MSVFNSVLEHIRLKKLNVCRKSISINSMLERAGLTSLRINPPFLNAEWRPKDRDRDAAWELYVEMLTRITTQMLPPEHGNEEAALESVYSLFPLTRDILKRQGRYCIEFTKIAVPVLNQIVRPFTAKWHQLKIDGAFKKADTRKEFRKELEDLQEKLKSYTRLLADIAKVEDLTELEKEASNDQKA